MTHKRDSVGHINVGDTKGSSLTSAKLNNQTRARRRTLSRKDKSSTADGNNSAESSRSSKKPRSKLMALHKRWQKKSSNNWIAPLLILITVLTYYYFVARKDPNHWLNMFVKLSYNREGTQLYGRGGRDFAFVSFYIVFFTFLREFFMQVVLKPLATALGLKTNHKINRFSEQMYSLIYYGITGPVGLYIMRYRCPELWYFNTTAVYAEFPPREIDVWLKAFYALQASFWAQQAIVLLLMLEKPRKDFLELIFHHIVTMALIYYSFRYHFTKLGLLIYITMDLSDFFLAFSKILNYLESPFVGPFYFLFVIVWIYLRHYINLKILYSVLTEFRTVGPFELVWETEQYKCWISQYVTFALLSLLQLVNLYWLALVLRIGYRYLKENVKEDVRSDIEDSSDNE